MPIRQCTKSYELGFNNAWTENFQMYKLVSEKAEEPEIKLPTSIGSWKKWGNSRKTYTRFIGYTKTVDCVDHNKVENS